MKRTDGRVRPSMKVSAQAKPRCKTLRCEGERKKVAKSLNPNCQEKPLVRRSVPVPKTDTGRQEENSKARERTLVKELGKMTP